MNEQVIVAAYLTAALWSSTDENGDSLEGKSVSLTARVDAAHDVRAFITLHRELLSESGLTDEQIGHDFWLTRNHHGAGFWDRGIGEIGDKLTDAAHHFGSVDLYIGTDGNVWGF